MRTFRIAVFAMLLISTGCSSTKTNENWWRTADEGSFTVEIPLWLHKVNVRGFDSHVGEYRSMKMRLSFDEVFGLGYTPEMGKARYEEYARRFEASPQD